ncbi:C-Maf-inducing protein-like isoform X1 [Branchiostoma floridae]|uniref:C-Maf-inducing protein-like isoform X1 n=1 Tax=Branchiostoma floridae TaxID=7739 RepID=A0A9J7LDP1_BRAFL|nr:C-Maf-inducing protein-like isoform X1 [Branchiostoma floridae]
MANASEPGNTTSNSGGPKTGFTVAAGTRYALLHEGDVQICWLHHTRTLVSKILSSKYLRRWEQHHVILDQGEIRSASPCGVMESAILYSAIEDMGKWDTGQKFCLRITVGDGSMLLQAGNAYLRDQWLYSIKWKRAVHRYRRILTNNQRPEVLMKEIKSLIDMSLKTQLQDDSIHQVPLEIFSQLLVKNPELIEKADQECLIRHMAPLLEDNQPSIEIAEFFSKICRDSPRSEIVTSIFTPIIQRILKHTSDFGKFPRLRMFVQDYILALNSQNDGTTSVKAFIKCMHGPASACPHHRVLYNLVSVCLAAIYSCFEDGVYHFNFGVHHSTIPEHKTTNSSTSSSMSSLESGEQTPGSDRKTTFNTRACYPGDTSPKYTPDEKRKIYGPNIMSSMDSLVDNGKAFGVLNNELYKSHGAEGRVNGHCREDSNMDSSVESVNSQGTKSDVAVNEVKLRMDYNDLGATGYTIGTRPKRPNVDMDGNLHFSPKLQYPQRMVPVTGLGGKNGVLRVKSLLITDKVMAERVTRCFVTILEEMSTYEDWRPGLAMLLHPIPFPKGALSNDTFAKHMRNVILTFAGDERCEVHCMILPVREGKDGWFHIFCPGSSTCNDEGEVFSAVVDRLMNCLCNKRKKFLTSLMKEEMRGPCLLLALRGDKTLIKVLCLILEMNIVIDNDLKLQLIATLESTDYGQMMYSILCQKQSQLRELQKEGGPTCLTMPSKSTDADLVRILSSGSFGNLVSLSLAFTQVTSTCAEHLIKLPTLTYLNLWSTQFGDAGLILLSEHLHKLQVLNLCETPVTDKGLESIKAMKSLQHLNLNSTKLSPDTYELLKENLPGLRSMDIRYTDAW